MGHLGRESWIPLALSLLAPAVVFAPPPNNGTATPTPPPTAAAAAVATSSSSSDNSLGYVFGILVAIGASIGFCVSIGMYVYGYYKGKYGNPKPRVSTLLHAFSSCCCSQLQLTIMVHMHTEKEESPQEPRGVGC